MSPRVSSPLFVGRSAELARLNEALDAAGVGAVRVVLLHGEPGIGKTRLLREFVQQARQRTGAMVAVGAALPFGEDGPPYAPIAEALRRLARELGADQFAALTGSAPAGWLAGTRSGTEANPVSQASLFESVLDVLERLGADVPVIVVLEDLHWADRSTRDLLMYLARLATGRLLIVGTYRSDEVGETHPLLQVAHELERAELAELIDVGGLEAEYLVRMLAGIAGAAIDDTIVARVVERSEGNPLFAEELLAGERAAPDGELPPAIRQVILQRVRRLSSRSQAVVRLVAAVGRDAEWDVLAGATDIENDELLEALRDAVRQAILRPRYDGERDAYTFRHALVREAIYAEVLPGERVEMHRRIALALTATVPGKGGLAAGRIVELAYHWDAAHDPHKALPASVRAGMASSEMHAYAAAHRHFERALALWDRIDPDEAIEASPVSRVALMERSAHAAAAIGEHAIAVERLQEAIAIHDEQGSTEATADLWIGLGRLHWSAGHDAPSMEAYERAAAAVPADRPSPARARALAAQASALMVRARYRESLALAEEALGMARELGARVEEGRALGVAGVDLAYLDEPERGVEYLELARGIAEEHVDPEELRTVFVNLSSVLLRSGRREEAVHIALDAADTARRMGLERTWGPVQLVNAAVGLYDLGRWDEAERVAMDALGRSGADVERCYLHVVQAQLAADRGRPEEARQHLESARELAAGVADPVLSASVAVTTAELALWESRASSAREAVDAGLKLLEGSDERPLAARLAAAGLAAEADLAASARTRRERGALSMTAERVQRLLDGVERLGSSGTTYADREVRAYASVARGHAARAGGKPDAAAWRDAIGAWRALDQPYPAAVVAWRGAEALLAARGPREEATELLREAHQLATPLGAAPLLTEIDLLARRARIELTPMAEAAETAVSPGAEIGLTGREEEVLGLVATGMTNREIAESLFISEKTASVHVSNILGKLGVSGRVEAAGVAFKLGILAGTSHDDDDHAEPRVAEAEGSAIERTFMFTDIARSTNLVEAIGDAAWTELLRWHDATLRSLFVTYGGEEVDHAGDGFFVAFGASDAAINCAVAIQRKLAGQRHSHGFAPSIRIGLHRAAANRVAGAYRGRGVHEAARIGGLAEPDEILISEKSLPPGRGNFTTLQPRDARLAGIPGTVRVVPITWR